MLHDEEILTFSEAAKALPRINGRKPHASTLWRWARKGLFGIRLEVLRIGHRFCTSKQALERFAAALAEVELQPRKISIRPTVPKPRGRTDKQRARAIADAERRLREAGV